MKATRNEPPADKPNLVVIMSDQHTPSVLGCYGNPVARTPCLDGLAASGTRFERAYCSNPVCVPSRMSMLTGLHSSRIRVWCNANALAPHWATWPLLLRLAGYTTVISGRNHMLWGDRLYGFGQRLCGEDGKSIPFLKEGSTSIGAGNRPQGIAHPVGALPVTAHAEHDVQATACAERYLASAPAEPFALFVGLYQPHAPFVTLPQYYDLYDDTTAQRHLEGFSGAPLPLYRDRVPPEPIDPAWFAAAARAYYGMVSHVDALVGRILAALERRGLLENTFVVYTSDHGEMLGRHRLWHKMTFYEDSVRVPLVVRPPGAAGAGTAVGNNVSLLDLFPTFLDIAGYPIDLPLDGHSLLPLLRGETDVRGHAIMAETIGVRRGEPGRMLKCDNLKLIQYYRRDPVLFDLAEDPRETRNLAGDAAYRAPLAAMQADLAHEWDVPALNRAFEDDLRQVFYHHLVSK